MSLNAMITVFVIVMNSWLATCLPHPSKTKETGKQLYSFQRIERIGLEQLGKRPKSSSSTRPLSIKTLSRNVDTTSRMLAGSSSSRSSSIDSKSFERTNSLKQQSKPSQNQPNSVTSRWKALLSRNRRCIVQYDHPCATSRRKFVFQGKTYYTYTCTRGFPACMACHGNICREKRVLRDGKVPVTKCYCDKW